MMKVNSIDNGARIPPEVLCQFNRLRPEIISLLTQAPIYGISSLEIHFLAGEIKRIVRHREESVLLTEGETI